MTPRSTLDSAPAAPRARRAAPSSHQPSASAPEHAGAKHTESQHRPSPRADAPRNAPSKHATPRTGTPSAAPSKDASSASSESDSSAFAALGLVGPLLRAIATTGFTEPTRIQTLAIPHAVAGKDVLGLAQTGTGKTAAFCLPMLQRLAAEKPKKPLARAPRALILAPTRELAQQIAEASAPFARALHLRTTVVHGGVSLRPQIEALARGVDVLIATPGRLEDLLQQRALSLGSVHALVLDEADRMLDEGFLPAVRRILALCPRDRQTMLFSATLPEAIESIAKHQMREPVRVEATPPNETPRKIEQTVWFCEQPEKLERLGVLLDQPSVERAIVFTRTKRGADRVAKKLVQMGLASVAIHGDKSQGQRDRALLAFKNGKVPILVATDIAARGIDVREVSHVVNYELPHEPESYVHRIGRTARAGASGIAWAFCSREERDRLKDIEKLLQERLVRGNDDPDERHRSTNPASRRHAPPRTQSSHRTAPATPASAPTRASSPRAQVASSERPAPRTREPQAQRPAAGSERTEGRAPARPQVNAAKTQAAPAKPQARGPQPPVSSHGRSAAPRERSAESPSRSHPAPARRAAPPQQSSARSDERAPQRREERSPRPEARDRRRS
ncbi:MAG: DEAD/DEAH box helicase [Planctomycetes bacterium]|nr:DEAD/DEAH box helicase [Planctomycetota bacterium]